MKPAPTSNLVSKVKSNVGESVAKLHESVLTALQDMDPKNRKAAGTELLESLKQRISERPVATLATAVALGVFWSRLLALPSFRMGVARGLGALVASSLLGGNSPPRDRRDKNLTH